MVLVPRTMKTRNGLGGGGKGSTSGSILHLHALPLCDHGERPFLDDSAVAWISEGAEKRSELFLL